MAATGDREIKRHRSRGQAVLEGLQPNFDLSFVFPKTNLQAAKRSMLTAWLKSSQSCTQLHHMHPLNNH